MCLPTQVTKCFPFTCHSYKKVMIEVSKKKKVFMSYHEDLFSFPTQELSSCYEQLLVRFLSSGALKQLCKRMNLAHRFSIEAFAVVSVIHGVLVTFSFFYG